MRTRVRKILGQLAWWLACLLLLELALWVFAPVANVGPDPPYYIEYRQDLPGLSPEVTYTQNVFGFRSQTMTSKQKPADTIRILCVGASTTDQPTQSTADTWCALLAERLSAPGGRRIETAGYGCGGARALDVLVWAREAVARYRPDIVITLLGINDLVLNGGPEYRYSDLASAEPTPCARHRGFDFKPLFLMDAGSIVRALSQIARRVERVRMKWARREDEQAGRVVEWHSANLPKLREMRRVFSSVPAPKREPDPFEGFADAVAALLDELQAAGVRPVVLAQPVLWRPDLSSQELAALWMPVRTRQGPVRADPGWLAAEMGRYNAAQSALARERGVPFVDLDAALPKSLDAFFDDCHFTDRGSAIVAQAIAQAVQHEVDALAAD